LVRYVSELHFPSERARCPTRFSEKSLSLKTSSCFNLHAGLKRKQSSSLNKLKDMQQNSNIHCLSPTHSIRIPIMYNNEMNNPTFSLHANNKAQQQKEKKHGNEDNTHSHSEEHPRSRSHITTVPFSRTKTGSFQ